MYRHIFALGLLLVIPACAIAGETTPAVEPQVACTMDAKLCPDGTAVGRTGPKCEFALCPGEKAEEKKEPVTP